MPRAAARVIRPAMLVLIVLAAFPDSLLAQKPRLQREVESENRQFRLRIEPGRPERQGRRGPEAGCTATLLGRDAGRGGRVWERPLVNPVAPLLTAVRDDGRFVVTLGDFPYGGVQNALVIYGDQGQLLRHFLLTDLLGGEDWRHVKRDRRRVEWLRDVEYGFDDPELFVVRLKWGRVIRIELQTLKLLDEPPPGEIPEDILALLASEERGGVEFEADEADVEAMLAEEEALRRFAEIQAADPGVDQQAMLMALLEQALAQVQQNESDPEVEARLREVIRAQLEAVHAGQAAAATEGADETAAPAEGLDAVEPVRIRGASREEIEAQLLEHMSPERAQMVLGIVGHALSSGNAVELDIRVANKSALAEISVSMVSSSGSGVRGGEAAAGDAADETAEPRGRLFFDVDGAETQWLAEQKPMGDRVPAEPQTLAGRILGADPPAPNVAEKTDYVSWYNSFAATEGPSAVPFYQSAADNYVDFAGGDELLTRALAGDAEALTSPEVTQWIEDNQLALADFREASNYDYNGMIAESEKGDMIGILLPYLVKHRGLTRALVADGRRMMLEGDVDGAMDAYVDAIAAGRQTGRGRTLIDSLVGTAMQAAGTEALLDAFATGGDTIDYAAVAEKLESAAAVQPRPMTELMQFERMMYMDATQRMFEMDPETNTPVVTPESLRRYNVLDYAGEGGGDPIRTMGMLSLDFKETTEIGNAYYDAITESFQQPYPEARASMEAVEQQLQEDTHPMIRTLLPALSRANFTSTRGETARRGTLLLARIKAYEQQNGAPPESLDAFGGASYTVDPFTNAPFRYERTPEGFRLYSAGGDSVDNGGIHDERAEQNDYVIWPRPPKQ